ncbi:hypothetical protein Tco_1372358 [Tanacetum coccineum]
MASMNTRLNIKKLDGNIIQKHRGSKQVGLKQLGSKQVSNNLVLNKLGSNNLVLVLKQESIEYRMKNMFGLRWNCRELKGIVKLRFFSWLASIKQGMLEPVKVKCIFMGYRKGTSSVQMLQGVEFEVEPQEDHNVDHVAGSQEVQTQNLIYYHLACDREQHSTHELFRYREDSNEAAFTIAEAEKIYAHESLTFNNTFACDVISKWKVRLKDDMDARSDVYVLSNGCRKCIDDSDGYYWKKGNVLGMEIVKDQSGNTLRVSQSRFYNGKLVQTLLEGHSILSLKGSLSGDCDVENNSKWSCIYAVGSQEYQMVCTRLDIASEDVGMLDKFDHGLQTDVQVFIDFDYAMRRSITVMGRSITRYELMIQGCA